MMRTGDHIRDDFGVLRIRDARLKHANDGRSAIADASEANGFADHRRILVKRVRPETVGENSDASSFGSVVFRPNQAAKHGMKAHYFKIIAPDDASSNGARLTEADHCEIHR